MPFLPEYLSSLSCCRHGGRLDEGMSYLHTSVAPPPVFATFSGQTGSMAHLPGALKGTAALFTESGPLARGSLFGFVGFLVFSHLVGRDRDRTHRLRPIQPGHCFVQRPDGCCQLSDAIEPQDPTG